MHIGRPPPSDGHHYDEWKMRMEVFLRYIDFDLWIIVNHKSITPTKVDSDGNKSIKREEEYDAEDRQMIQQNSKAKDLLYKSLPRSVLYKVSSCISAHDIWRTLESDF
ncbi:uncharacterized protein [Nicotiana tomentosiformis]|uniref:uncharacterized protein n=1 Tax=Nicotiana tomentosiformis TaxID=4098 RepID=UPI00388C4C7D